MTDKRKIQLIAGFTRDGLIKYFPEVITKNTDLAGIDFSRLNLSGIDFSYSDLSYCNFSNCVLTDAMFNYAVFHDTIFIASSGLTPSIIETHRSDIFLTDKDYEDSHRNGDAS